MKIEEQLAQIDQTLARIDASFARIAVIEAEIDASLNRPSSVNLAKIHADLFLLFTICTLFSFAGIAVLLAK
jgi:hypothetical protein